MEKLRSTPLYKMYGYFGYIYLISLVLFVLNGIGLISLFFPGLLPILVLFGFPILLVMPIAFFVTFYITKNKNVISNTSICVDIGNIINIILLFIFLFLFIIGYYEIDNKYNNNTITITNEYLIKAEKEIKQQGLNNYTKMLLADGYRLAGQHETAIKMYNDLIKDDSGAYLGLALTYLREKKYEEVIKYIDLFLENYPTTKLGTAQQQRMTYQLIYKEKAKAHWKLHQYIKWAKIYKKTFYQYAMP